MRAKLFFFFAFLSLLSISLSSAASQELTILHFNDLHGKLEEEKSQKEISGGAARLATIIDRIRRENKKEGRGTLLLFGGDAVTGSLLSSQFKGDIEFRFFEMIDLDAMVIGNHEFDFGASMLRKRIEEASFPILGANILWKEGERPFAPATFLIPLDHETTIGILGLTTEETIVTTTPSHVRDIHFQPVIETAQQLFPALERSSKLQIALTHQGVNGDLALATALPGIDVIIGGHDHVSPAETCRTIQGRPICQTPPYGKFLGRIDLALDGEKITLLSTTLIPVDSLVLPDRKVSRLIQKYRKHLDKKFKEVVATSTALLEHTRSRESALGNLIADIARQRLGTEVALINSGGIRRSLEKGDITLEMLYETLPFGNRLARLTVTGRELQNILDYSVKKGGGAFLQVSGLTFHQEKQRATNVQINGKPLSSTRLYRVGTVDFLVEGGDGYTFGKRAQKKEILEELLLSAVVEVFQKERHISPPAMGRVKPGKLGPVDQGKPARQF